MPQTAFEREIRFALVMYGGVSLAIYINGVTQEFLHLVKSTAVDANGNLLLTEVSGTEKVYRQLASLLNSAGEMNQPDDTLRTKFIVDIASGSSAGGINALFLGKALANNLSLDQLQDLWIMQAGFEDLLNDSRGIEGDTFSQNPPKSLLNSSSIYNKLVNAFVGMELSSQKPHVPLQPEMDVFATATDLQGLELPIELADEQVFEKKHKQVFHLRFATDEKGHIVPNDFSHEMNSFLAFAARATSSFPVAFEPMCLGDIDKVLAQNPRANRLYRSTEVKLKDFFQDYTSSLQDGGYLKRAFGDGGDLDNKPFSHAIDMLSQRTTDLPMQRKLVYIEPSPDKVEVNEVLSPPDFIQNTLAATVTLHQNETIREDLQHILDRNRLIDRVKEVTAQVDQDVQTWKSNREGFINRREGSEYQQRTITDEIHDRGPGYAGYYRLKVRCVSDDLAGIVTRAAELLETSDEYRAIRYLIGYWRNATYKEDIPGDKGGSAYLLAFDLGYRQRRLRFLLNKLDEIYPSHNSVERQEIKSLKKELNKVAKKLGDLQRRGEQRGSANFIFDEVKKLKIDAAGRMWLRDLLGMRSAERDAEVRKTIPLKALQEIADFISGEYRSVLIEAADNMKFCLDPNHANAKTPSARALREQMKQLFDEYEFYDQVIFPIFYETSVGEAEPASVIRISPQDATSLIDESNDSRKRKKLAGTTLFHFGAFFDRLWRSNDVLWGRLDGAERIITSLLPRNSKHAKKLIKAAHLEIIREQLRPQEQAELQAMMVRAILSMPRDSQEKEAKLREILENQTRKPVDPKVEAVFTACLEDENIYHYLRTEYEVNRDFDPARALDVLSRSTQIIGNMFEDVAKSSQSDAVRGALGKPSAWIARLGSVFWGIVQVAIPGALGNKVYRHWLKILYALEVVLLIGSTIAISGETQQFAVTALLFTAGIHLLTTVLGDMMQTRRWLIRVPLFLVLTMVLLLAVIGAWTVKKEAAAVSEAIQQQLPWAPKIAKQ
jgi:patatin-related protein